jgi:hypothetical protein
VVLPHKESIISANIRSSEGLPCVKTWSSSPKKWWSRTTGRPLVSTPDVLCLQVASPRISRWSVVLRRPLLGESFSPPHIRALFIHSSDSSLITHLLPISLPCYSCSFHVNFCTCSVEKGRQRNCLKYIYKSYFPLITLT